MDDMDTFRPYRRERVVFSTFQWWAFCATLLLIIILSGMFAYFTGRTDGYKNAVSDTRTSNTLPECQEDEYLYPANYEGPGKNEPADYKCIHVDDAVIPTVVRTLVALHLLSPNEAEGFVLDSPEAIDTSGTPDGE